MEHYIFEILTCKLSCAHVNIAGQELHMQHKICLERNTMFRYSSFLHMYLHYCKEQHFRPKSQHQCESKAGIFPPPPRLPVLKRWRSSHKLGWVFYAPDLFGEAINVAILPISGDSHARKYCLSIGAHFHYTCCGEILDTKFVLLVWSWFLSKGIASLPSRIPSQKTQLSSGIVFLSYSKYDGLAVFTFPRISPGLWHNSLQKSPQEQCLMLCKLFQLVKRGFWLWQK